MSAAVYSNHAAMWPSLAGFGFILERDFMEERVVQRLLLCFISSLSNWFRKWVCPQPRLIGIKQKYMEWCSALAVRLTGSINVCRGNRIRKMCVLERVCASTDMQMCMHVFLDWLWVPVFAYQLSITLSAQGQCKHVISFRTENVVLSFFLVLADVCSCLSCLPSPESHEIYYLLIWYE